MRGVRILVLAFMCQGIWAASQPRYGGTLRVGIDEGLRGIDPAYATTRGEFQVLLACHTCLVRTGPSGEILPGIARRWEASPDRMSWRFWIAQDARFWDGSAVGAGHVKESLERVLELPTPWRWMLEGIHRSGEGQVTGIVVEDPRCLRIDLSSPDPEWLMWLAQPPLSVVKAMQGEIMGTGPFELTDVEDGKWVLCRKEATAGGPYLDAIEFIHIPEPEARILEFELGELDCVHLDVQDYQRLSHDIRWRDGLTITPRHSRPIHLVVDSRKPSLSTSDVRRALRRAIDLREICDELFEPLAVEGRGILGEPADEIASLWDPGEYAPHVLESRWRRRPTEGLRLWFPEGSSELRRLAEKLQLDLSQAGLTVSLASSPWDSFHVGWREGAYDMAVVDFSRAGWMPVKGEVGLGPLTALVRAATVSFLLPDGGRPMEELLRRARGLREGEKRVRLAWEAERLCLEEAWWIPLVAMRIPAARQPWAHGVRILPSGLLQVEGAWLDGDVPERDPNNQ